MMHTSRTWTVARVESAEELAMKLTEHTWCCCNGFELGNYWFLNDATSGDGAQEYAVVKKVGPDGSPWQVESITFSWCTLDQALRLIQETLREEYDQEDWAHPVDVRIETPEAHGRCHHCA